MSNRVKWLLGLGFMFAGLFLFFYSFGSALASGACHVDSLTADPTSGVVGQTVVFKTTVHCDDGKKVGPVQISGFSTLIGADQGKSEVTGSVVLTVTGDVDIEVRVSADDDLFDFEKFSQKYHIDPIGQTVLPTVAPPAQTSSATVQSAGDPSGKKVQVNTTNLNLRTLPSPFAPVIEVAPKGTVFVYLGQTTDCDGTLWYSVKDDAHAGWLKGKFSLLEDGTPVIELHPDCSSLNGGAATATPALTLTPGLVATELPQKIVVLKDTQVFSEPSAEVSPIQVVAKGATFTYVGQKDGWYEINIGASNAWVPMVFAKVVVTTTATPTATPTTVSAAAAGTPSAIGTIVPCVGAPPSRLFGLTAARSTPDGEPLAIRALPGSDAAKLGSIANGESVTIIGGPKCHSGKYWYQITYLGVTGWSAEGIQGKWFLESVDQTVEPTAEG